MERNVFRLGPGGIMVVGPHGEFIIALLGNGTIAGVNAHNCDFIGTDNMTKEHRAIVDQVWASRTEDGQIIERSTPPENPDPRTKGG